MPLNESWAPDGERFYSSPKFWRGTLGFVLILLFSIAFWPELRLIGKLVIAYFLAIVEKSVILPLTTETFRAAFVLLSNILITIVGYLLLILWISPFVLPVHNTTEKRKVFNQ